MKNAGIDCEVTVSAALCSSGSSSAHDQAQCTACRACTHGCLTVYCTTQCSLAVTAGDGGGVGFPIAARLSGASGAPMTMRHWMSWRKTAPQTTPQSQVRCSSLLLVCHTCWAKHVCMPCTRLEFVQVARASGATWELLVPATVHASFVFCSSNFDRVAAHVQYSLCFAPTSTHRHPAAGDADGRQGSGLPQARQAAALQHTA